MNGARMGRSNVGRVYARRTHRRRAHFDSHKLRSHTNTIQHAIENQNRETNVRDQNNVQLSLRSLIIIIIIVVVEALSSLSRARYTNRAQRRDTAERIVNCIVFRLCCDILTRPPHQLRTACFMNNSYLSRQAHEPVKCKAYPHRTQHRL